MDEKRKNEIAWLILKDLIKEKSIEFVANLDGLDETRRNQIAWLTLKSLTKEKGVKFLPAEEVYRKVEPLGISRGEIKQFVRILINEVTDNFFEEKN